MRVTKASEDLIADNSHHFASRLVGSIGFLLEQLMLDFEKAGLSVSDAEQDSLLLESVIFAAVVLHAKGRMVYVGPEFKTFAENTNEAFIGLLAALFETGDYFDKDFVERLESEYHKQLANRQQDYKNVSSNAQFRILRTLWLGRLIDATFLERCLVARLGRADIRGVPLERYTKTLVSEVNQAWKMHRLAAR